MSPDVRIARLSAGDELMIEDGVRTVLVPTAGVARYLNRKREHLKMGDVRAIADELLKKPNRVGGRIIHCAEMDDPDRGAFPAAPASVHEMISPFPPDLPTNDISTPPANAFNEPMLLSPAERWKLWRCNCAAYAGDNPKCPFHLDEERRSQGDGEDGG